MGSRPNERAKWRRAARAFLSSLCFRPVVLLYRLIPSCAVPCLLWRARVLVVPCQRCSIILLHFLVTVIVYYSMSFSLFCSSYLISLPGTAHGTADRGQSTDDRDERDLASPFWQNNPVLVILLEFLTPPDPFEESNEEDAILALLYYSRILEYPEYLEGCCYSRLE